MKNATQAQKQEVTRKAFAAAIEEMGRLQDEEDPEVIVRAVLRARTAIQKVETEEDAALNERGFYGADILRDHILASAFFSATSAPAGDTHPHCLAGLQWLGFARAFILLSARDQYEHVVSSISFSDETPGMADGLAQKVLPDVTE